MTGMTNKNKVLLRRFLAFLIDYYLISIVPSICIAVILLSKTGMCEDIGLAIFTAVFSYIFPVILFEMPLQAFLTVSLCLFVSAITVYCVYCFITEFFFGKTIGQKITNIICVNCEGKVLSKKETAIKNVTKYICLLFCCIGLLPILFTKKRATLYDILLKIEVK